VAETAILVPVPEAAALVDAHRLRLTRAGADGFPPHITLLYPFTDSALLTDGRIRQTAAIVAAEQPLDVSFASTAGFDSEPPILYLAPEPAEPFARLTRALVAAFPEHPPYGRSDADVVPHLTVAIAAAEVLAPVELELLPLLPVTARVTEAWLMQRGGDGRWALRQRLPLGG